MLRKSIGFNNRKDKCGKMQIKHWLISFIESCCVFWTHIHTHTHLMRCIRHNACNKFNEKNIKHRETMSEVSIESNKTILLCFLFSSYVQSSFPLFLFFFANVNRKFNWFRYVAFFVQTTYTHTHTHDMCDSKYIVIGFSFAVTCLKAHKFQLVYSNIQIFRHLRIS